MSDRGEMQHLTIESCLTRFHPPVRINAIFPTRGQTCRAARPAAARRRRVRGNWRTSGGDSLERHAGSLGPTVEGAEVAYGGTVRIEHADDGDNARPLNEADAAGLFERVAAGAVDADQLQLLLS
jgi:hypothetical protein